METRGLCLGRVGRAGRTAANVCSGWVRGRLRYPETVPSWLETTARALGGTAEDVLFGGQTNREWRQFEYETRKK